MRRSPAQSSQRIRSSRCDHTAISCNASHQDKLMAGHLGVKTPSDPATFPLLSGTENNHSSGNTWTANEELSDAKGSWKHLSNFQVRPARERQLKHRLCTLLQSAENRPQDPSSPSRRKCGQTVQKHRSDRNTYPLSSQALRKKMTTCRIRGTRGNNVQTFTPSRRKCVKFFQTQLQTDERTHREVAARYKGLVELKKLSKESVVDPDHGPKQPWPRTGTPTEDDLNLRHLSPPSAGATGRASRPGSESTSLAPCSPPSTRHRCRQPGWYRHQGEPFDQRSAWMSLSAHAAPHSSARRPSHFLGVGEKCDKYTLKMLRRSIQKR